MADHGVRKSQRLASSFIGCMGRQGADLTNKSLGAILLSGKGVASANQRSSLSGRPRTRFNPMQVIGKRGTVAGDPDDDVGCAQVLERHCAARSKFCE